MQLRDGAHFAFGVEQCMNNSPRSATESKAGVFTQSQS